MVGTVTEESNDYFANRSSVPKKKVAIISLLVTGSLTRVTTISLLADRPWKKVTIISPLVTGPRDPAKANNVEARGPVAASLRASGATV